ncbi:hypothetical protein BDV34DRAFT_195941 [Aspergillus parasiticus]|uniref:Uncharacterized protein n=1 Tax=Aspergillus parasiticus TaxID=5067 RepID=A0A5N6DJE6_ASPPA|nr:hypothetical protein BDV34DRAFT_195941 [Aspergillus parasiticus]
MLFSNTHATCSLCRMKNICFSRSILTQWLSDHCEAHPKHAYEGRQGNWRPDLLIPAKICEINGRFFSLSPDLGS